MTTVPKPRRVKTRSTGSRRRPDGIARRRLAREGEKRGSRSVGEPLPRAGGDAQHRAGPRGRSPGPARAPPARPGPGSRRRPRRTCVRTTRPARDAQQPADVEVLAGLRHDRLVGRHHQDHRVDAEGPRQHVAHEALVAGHVDEGGHHPVPEVRVGEAQVDGDAPLLLLLEAVGVGAGEGANEGALAVVDVPGGADHERARATLRCGWPPPRRPTPRSCGAWRPGPGGLPSPRAR